MHDTLTRSGSVPTTDPGLVLPRGVRLPVVVAVVVGVGVGLRLWSFSPFWLDEAQSVAFARMSLGELPGALRIDGAPPLYYALLHVWIQVFGDGVWTARALSMVLSIAALPLMWLLVRRLRGDATTAVIAVLLLAVNPWAIRYAGEARMYSLVVVEVLLVSLALLRLRRAPEIRTAAGLALVAAALLYTHYWALFLLAPIGCLLLVAAWRRPAERAFAGHALGALAAAAVAYLPWVPTMLYQSERTGSPWAPTPTLDTLTDLPSQWFGNDGVGGVLAILLLALAVFARRQPDGTVVLATRPSGVTGVVGAIMVATLLLALGAARLSDAGIVVRYTAVVVPAVIVLLAFGARKLPGLACTGMVAAMLVIGVAGGVTAATTPHTKAGKIAEVLNARVAKGDLIVYCPDQLAPAIEERLELSKKVNRLTIPEQTNPRILDWTDYMDRLADTSPRSVASGLTRYLKNQPEGSVWLISSRSYGTTLNSTCDALRARMNAGLGEPQTVLNATGRGLENAKVERFSR
ncbi:MAG: glycosyltransferase family 39 protein [Sporichthyaceae bacterium]